MTVTSLVAPAFGGELCRLRLEALAQHREQPVGGLLAAHRLRARRRPRASCWRDPCRQVIGLAALSTALAYIVFFQILRRSGATNVMLVTLLIPVTAILLGIGALGLIGFKIGPLTVAQSFRPPATQRLYDVCVIGSQLGGVVAGLGVLVASGASSLLERIDPFEQLSHLARALATPPRTRSRRPAGATGAGGRTSRTARSPTSR